jgi:hypothetical protein
LQVLLDLETFIGNDRATVENDFGDLPLVYHTRAYS